MGSVPNGTHLAARGEDPPGADRCAGAARSCAELRGDEREAGIRSRDWLRARIGGKQVLLRTLKDKKGKFGRYLGEIWLDGANINDALVEEGLAEYKDY